MFFQNEIELFKLLFLFLSGGALLGFFLRVATKAAHPRRDYTLQPKVTVLLPVYNEGAGVLNTIDSIFAADWPAGKLEVIAVDDCSKDDSYRYLEEARDRYGDRIKIGRNRVNSGKHRTLVNAAREATGEVFLCIDSDCLFDRNVIRELMACFCDPKVGAVGGAVGVRNVNDNVLTMAQAVLYFRTFHFGRLLQIMLKNVMVISGCLFAIRAPIYRDLESDINRHHFLGVPLRSGEDRYMTHLVALRGWHTLTNPNAICWTSVPNRFWTLFAQQQRWARSHVKDVLWTLSTLPSNFKKVGVARTLAWLNPSVAGLLLTLFTLLSVATNGPGTFIRLVGFGMLYVAVISLFFACLYNWLAPILMPGSTRLANPLYLALAGAWGPLMFLLKFVALLTQDVEAWGTRQSAPASPQQPPLSR